MLGRLLPLHYRLSVLPGHGKVVAAGQVLKRYNVAILLLVTFLCHRDRQEQHRCDP